MTDHLPECYLSGPPSLCPMCEALRACEQRVLNAIDLASANVKYQSIGFAAGLDAAREAIRNREDGEYFPWAQVEISLAAIDALREEQK